MNTESTDTSDNSNAVPPYATQREILAEIARTSAEFWRPRVAQRRHPPSQQHPPYWMKNIAAFRLTCSEMPETPLRNGVHCRRFRGPLNKKGYGLWRADFGHKQPKLAHRFAWEVFHKHDIPEGWQVHHLCFNPICAEPYHLDAMPPRQHRKIHSDEGPRVYQPPPTDGEIRAVLLRWKMGQSVKEIAEDLHLAQSNVRYWLSAADPTLADSAHA